MSSRYGCRRCAPTAIRWCGHRARLRTVPAICRNRPCSRRDRGAELILSPANLAPRRRDATSSSSDAAALLQGLLRRVRRLAAGSCRCSPRAPPASCSPPRTFSRGELIELLGADPDAVVVVPEGVDERFTPASDPAPARRRYALERPYALVVGTVSDRKNLGALEPVARALGDHGIELVLAGSGRGYLRGDVPGVRRLGYVAGTLARAVRRRAHWAVPFPL